MSDRTRNKWGTGFVLWMRKNKGNLRRCRQDGFEDASEAAKQLEDGDFLPQLKFDALKELEQRMSKIKTEECGL